MQRRSATPGARLTLEGREFRSDSGGGLRVTPRLRPPDAALLHDGTNLSLEREMSDLAENALAHQAAARLLEGRFEGLRKAIRGRL
jgi:flagellar basal body rod protein FlgB